MRDGVPKSGLDPSSLRALRRYLIPFGLGVGALCAAVFEIVTVLTAATPESPLLILFSLLPYALAFVAPFGLVIGAITGVAVMAMTYVTRSLSKSFHVGISALVAFLVDGSATSLARGLFADPGPTWVNFVVSGVAAAASFGWFVARVSRTSERSRIGTRESQPTDWLSGHCL